MVSHLYLKKTHHFLSQVTHLITQESKAHVEYHSSMGEFIDILRERGALAELTCFISNMVVTHCGNSYQGYIFMKFVCITVRP